mmetsp:Transcript_18848/g.66595  ORF Transcript_18848/g.66595 Transcript_18848/m.66595 type:complete len:216 (-) Transcript_18848:202-849(-)
MPTTRPARPAHPVNANAYGVDNRPSPMKTFTQLNPVCHVLARWAGSPMTRRPLPEPLPLLMTLPGASSPPRLPYALPNGPLLVISGDDIVMESPVTSSSPCNSSCSYPDGNSSSPWPPPSGSTPSGPARLPPGVPPAVRLRVRPSLTYMPRVAPANDCVCPRKLESHAAIDVASSACREGAMDRRWYIARAGDVMVAGAQRARVPDNYDAQRAHA